VRREKLSHAEPARPEIRLHPAQFAVSRLIANHPTGLSLPQKQLALICVLEELVNGMPGDYQNSNILAVISTLLLGSRLLTAISGAAPAPHSEDA
jgi:hypothetical protein